ncbi:hypothetical protein JZ751_008468 [Albula glossodonta]|uniref:Uncharacterized protein n=1 Tax=Albula glossodonta TaxID=121402 RepID=A0A8T2N486_9TELE|nr:hypothetical protein JZ751_008468 [Albula glossodonta]
MAAEHLEDRRQMAKLEGTRQNCAACLVSVAQHFPSSGLTLNERFAMYQRRAAEKEMARPRKSPEIHR